MPTAIATLRSITPYSQSRYHESPAQPNESKDEYEMRTWRERMHFNKDGDVFIPPMSFKNALAEAAKYLNIRITGGGRSTYTKHFRSGVIVGTPLPVGVHKDEVPGDVLFLNSDGKRGGGTRVKRKMPRIDEWDGDVEFTIIDDKITPEVFERVLIAAGSVIGIGRFRPENGGYYGRFSVEGVRWETE
jgi:hypothetical protein